MISEASLGSRRAFRHGHGDHVTTNGLDGALYTPKALRPACEKANTKFAMCVIRNDLPEQASTSVMALAWNERSITAPFII
jgi:hypothetical protein